MNKQLTLLSENHTYIDTVTPMELRKLRRDIPCKMSTYTTGGVTKTVVFAKGDIDEVNTKLKALRGDT